MKSLLFTQEWPSKAMFFSQSVASDCFATPWTVAQQPPLSKNTGVDCHFLLQEIFPAQG